MSIFPNYRYHPFFFPLAIFPPRSSLVAELSSFLFFGFFLFLHFFFGLSSLLIFLAFTSILLVVCQAFTPKINFFLILACSFWLLFLVNSLIDYLIDYLYRPHIPLFFVYGFFPLFLSLPLSIIYSFAPWLSLFALSIPLIPSVTFYTVFPLLDCFSFFPSLFHSHLSPSSLATSDSSSSPLYLTL